VTLEDDAIRLRPFTLEDVPALVAALDGDEDVARWTRIPSPYTEGDAREFITGTSERAFAVCDAATGDLIGGIGAREYDEDVVEVGYWVRADRRGQGVAPRALRLVTRWAIEELGAGRVQLITAPDNVGSRRVAEKVGFRREGLLRSFVLIKGTRRDAVMYSLLPDDLQGPPRTTTRFRA
jgi:RimJ/RimL family protein N-acetyltransferase